MEFVLFKKLDSTLSYYGDIPEIPDNNRDEYVEIFKPEEEDREPLLEDFVWQHHPDFFLLDNYDVDYFDGEECEYLLNWLQNRLKSPVTPRLKELYTILIDYVQRALQYKTGVLIEM